LIAGTTADWDGWLCARGELRDAIAKEWVRVEREASSKVLEDLLEVLDILGLVGQGHSAEGEKEES
jgi:hypothetical protein